MGEETKGIITLLRELGPWIISLVAILQFWADKLWRNLRKGKVEIYETGPIELGYSTSGPSMALAGTLYGLNKGVFVKNVRLRVERLKDNARFTFNWRAFRPKVITFGAQKSPEFEIVSSFLLTPNEPFKYNIFFVDDAFVAEYRPKVLPYIKEWNEFLSGKLVIEEDWKTNPVLLERIYAEFSKTECAVNTYSLLDRAFYWHEGEYKLEFIVETARPSKQFPKVWFFKLGNEDVKNLRINTVVALREFCEFSAIYNFAFPEYVKSE